MSAGELAEHFPVSKPTMSAHFAVLREAGLVESEKQGKALIYRLRMSVLEEALMEFTQLFGLDLTHREEPGAGHGPRTQETEKTQETQEIQETQETQETQEIRP